MKQLIKTLDTRVTALKKELHEAGKARDGNPFNNEHYFLMLGKFGAMVEALEIAKAQSKKK